MRHFFLAISILLVGVVSPAFSQSFGDMSAAELLRTLRAKIVDIKEVERTLSQNTQAAEDNKKQADSLRSLDQTLENRGQAYDREVANHNRQVNAYNDQCIGSKLPEDQYTQCLNLKQNLDLQKTRLDAEGDNLQSDFTAFNDNVRDLNSREGSRAEAAARLLAQYEQLDTDIRTIQLRLYDIAVSRDNNGFAENVRQCTKRETLDAIYSCMSSAFN